MSPSAVRAAAAAAVLPTLLLLPMVVSGGVPDFCDPVTQAYPYHVHLARELRAGALPLFNPYHMGGASFIGNVQAGILYPPRLIATSLFGRGAFALLLLLHMAAAAAGAALLASRLGVGGAGTFVAGATYALGGYLWGKLALPPILFVASLGPWLLLCVDRVLCERAGGAALAAMTALVLTAGHPQTAITLLLLSIAYVLVRRIGFDVVRERGGPIPGIVRILSAGFLLSFVAGIFTLGGADRPAFHPGRPLVWLALCAVLSLYGFWRGAMRIERRPAPGLLRPLSFMVLGMALSAGQLLPVAENVARSRPPRRAEVEGFAPVVRRLDLFIDAFVGHRRDYEASLFVGPLPLVLAFIACAGRGRVKAGLRSLAILALLFYVVACGPHALRPILVRLPIVSVFPALSRYLLVPAMVLPLLAGRGIDLVTERWPGRRTTAPLLLLLIAPLLPAAMGRVPRLPAAAIEAPSSLAATLASDQPVRFISLDRDPPLMGLDHRRADRLELLFPNLGTIHGLEDAQGYDPVHGWPITLLEEAVYAGGRWPADDTYHFVSFLPARGRRHGRTDLLRLFGVRYAFAHGGARAPSGFVLRRASPLGTLWELPDTLPRAFVATRAHTEPDPRRALKLLQSLDPASDVILEEPVAALPAPPASSPLVRRIGSGRLAVEGRLHGIVVITELHDPGWRAWLDGAPVALRRADGVLMAAVCRSGRRLDLAYLPAGARVGIFVSLLAFGFVAATRTWG